MDLTPDAAREILLRPIACGTCFEKNQVDNVGFSKKAIENAPFCPSCAKKVVDEVLDEAGCGPLHLR